uniref:Transposase Tc1-like domain-containing protein n=1 Tax=Lates calcarifer TaxID=8187 RepID=A0A4W6BT78_LATCA
METLWDCGYSSEKWAPNQNDPKSTRILINEVKKQPRVTAKDLKASLELANICVHESTVRKTLNKQGVYGRTPRRKPLLIKKNVCMSAETLQKLGDAKGQ